MASVLLQPIPFFSRLDSQYQRYLKAILTSQQRDALLWFIHHADRKNIIEQRNDTTITKELCHELDIKDEDNCRKITRKLMKLNFILRETDKKFILNPSLCNRMQILWPGAMKGFINLTETREYLIWKLTDDQRADKSLSLKRRLRFAEFTGMDRLETESSEANTTTKETEMLQASIAGLQDQVKDLTASIQDMRQLLRELAGKFNMDEETEVKVKRHLELVRD